MSPNLSVLRINVLIIKISIKNDITWRFNLNIYVAISWNIHWMFGHKSIMRTICLSFEEINYKRLTFLSRYMLINLLQILLSRVYFIASYTLYFIIYNSIVIFIIRWFYWNMAACLSTCVEAHVIRNYTPHHHLWISVLHVVKVRRY